MEFKNTKKTAVKGSTSNIPLRFVAIGDGVTKNLTVYEYGEDIIAVDFGIGFPELEDFGVDFIIPDMTYLLENSHKVRGLFITHAHADHFAAIPFLLKELNVPVYANKLTQEFIKELLEEKEFKRFKDSVSLHLFDASTNPVSLGAFTVSAFHVNHSVPDSLGMVIKSPQGTVVHMADFKIDQTPVIDAPIDLEAISRIGEEGVLCLASDCLGASKDGFIESERSLDETFPSLFGELQGKQIFITTISSNISRIRQIVDAAIKAGRKVVPVGRSIEKSINIAKNLGYLPFSDNAFMGVKKAEGLPQDSLVYIIAGCFGQPGSSLDKLSRREHRHVSVKKGGYVVFSSEPNPPGTDIAVGRVVDNLILMGVEVIDHLNRNAMHVSGHGHRGDLSQVASLVKPKYFIPIGGTIRQIHDYAKMIGKLGFNENSVFELQEGEVVEFRNNSAVKGKRIEVHDQYVDGIGLSPIVIRDRGLLSTDGVLVVVVPVSRKGRQRVGKVDIITRGFIYVKESKALLGKSRDVVNKAIEKDGDIANNWGGIKTNIEKDLKKFLSKETGREPLIIVHSIFI